ncbi:MAG: hypothetical protein KA354_17595 [Phycisphaerae bacterium]|nr:hypothetical protein [Phycisphaerae bacterium]
MSSLIRADVRHMWASSIILAFAPAVSGGQVIGQLADPEQPAEVAYVDILSAWVEQDGGLLTFVIETRGEIPPSLAEPEDHLTFIWLVDTDDNPLTGQPHQNLGSEFNVRAVISGMYGGGFVDVTGTVPGGGLGTLAVLGNRIQITIGLGQIGNPAAFRWSCDACLAIANVCVSANHETDTALASVLPFAPPAHVTIVTPFLPLCPTGPATGQLTVEIRDAAGNLLPSEDYHLAFTSSDEATATVDAAGIATIHTFPTPEHHMSYVQVSADGVPSDNAAVVRSTFTDLGLSYQMYPAEHIAFYLPSTIQGVDLDAITTAYQVPEATERAYVAERTLTDVRPFNGGVQYFILEVSDHEPTTPCGISGNPMRLGWFWGKTEHNSCYIINAPEHRTPQWFVIFHEVGHNFTWSSWSFGQFCSGPSPAHNTTYSEGLASLAAMWVHHSIVSCPAGLGSLAVSDIDAHLGGYMGFFRQMLSDYRVAGANYAAFDANVLDGILCELFDAYGPRVWYELFSTFTPTDQPLPCVIDGEAKQATWFVAAVSASVGEDLRSLFAGRYGFPIDDASWPEMLAAAQARIAARPWRSPLSFDSDCDGDVDGDDFIPFEACTSGPAIAYMGDCAKADLDRDGDVDQSDFGIFQRCYSGTGKPADPDCAK